MEHSTFKMIFLLHQTFTKCLGSCCQLLWRL